VSGARHFSELIVWKLADEIRTETFTLTAKPGFVRDVRARSQAEDAANSVCRNIAEGFGCDSHREFARFLVISRRSLNELHDILRGAELKKYVNTDDLGPVRALSTRFYPAMGRLLGYLHSTRAGGKPREGTTARRAKPARTRNRTDKEQ
jgi:four helix bundle protein